MGKVIKRGGKKQTFRGSKIKNSILKAGKDAKLTAIKLKEIIQVVVNPIISRFRVKKLVKATELRKAILRKLDRKEKSVSAAWRRHDKKRRK